VWVWAHAEASNTHNTHVNKTIRQGEVGRLTLRRPSGSQCARACRRTTTRAPAPGPARSASTLPPPLRYISGYESGYGYCLASYGTAYRRVLHTTRTRRRTRIRSRHTSVVADDADHTQLGADQSVDLRDRKAERAVAVEHPHLPAPGTVSNYVPGVSTFSNYVPGVSTISNYVPGFEDTRAPRPSRTRRRRLRESVALQSRFTDSRSGYESGYGYCLSPYGTAYRRVLRTTRTRLWI